MVKTGIILKQDIISHFTCRMLYCKEPANHQKFVEMERQILSTKLYQQNGIDHYKKQRYMSLLKKLVSFFLRRKVEELHVPAEDWSRFGNKIMHKDMTGKNADTIDMYALVPIEHG